MGKGFIAQLFALAVRLVGEAFEEQHTEDDCLELRVIHLASKNISGLKGR